MPLMIARPRWPLAALAALVVGAVSLAVVRSDDGGQHGSSVSAEDAIRRIALDGDDTEYFVEYVSEGSQPEGVQSRTFTFAAKNGRSYMRVLLIGGREDGREVVIIHEDGRETLCGREPGGEGSCFISQRSSDESAGAPTARAMLEEFESGMTVSGTRTRTIVGRKASCFTYRGDNEPEEGLLCFERETGVATLLETRDGEGNVTKLTATRFSTSVVDSLFAPPAGWSTRNPDGPTPTSQRGPSQATPQPPPRPSSSASPR